MCYDGFMPSFIEVIGADGTLKEWGYVYPQQVGKIKIASGDFRSDDSYFLVTCAANDAKTKVLTALRLQ